MKPILAAAAFALTAACATPPPSAPPPAPIAQPIDEIAAIRNVLAVQKNAWNAGSIEGFMDGYWRSPELRFASGGNVTKGWQATLDRYRSRYSDRSKMGKLDFTNLDVDQVSSDAAIVHGNWKLTRIADAPHGLFTLVLRKIDGRWLVVSDTTTSGGA